MAVLQVTGDPPFYIGGGKAKAPEPQREDWTRFSPSQVTMYMRCSLQYYFRYICGLKRPPNGNMSRGSAVHRAYELGYREKHKSKGKRMLSADDMTDIFLEDFGKRLTGDHPREDEVVLEPNEDRFTMEVEAIRAIRMYRKELMPKIQPGTVTRKDSKTGKNKQVPGIELQFQQVKMPQFGEGVTVTGFVDLVDNHMVVIDHKTSKSKPPADEMMIRDKLVQLVIYEMLLKEALGIQAKGLRLDFTVIQKTQSQLIHAPNADGTPFKTPKQFHAQVTAIVRNLDKCIKHKLFNPVFQRSVCSWCGYQHECDQWTGK